MFTSNAQFLEKLLDKVFYQNQKVNQESRKCGVQNTGDPPQQRGKGAPWKTVKGESWDVIWAPVEGLWFRLEQCCPILICTCLTLTMCNEAAVLSVRLCLLQKGSTLPRSGEETGAGSEAESTEQPLPLTVLHPKLRGLVGAPAPLQWTLGLPGLPGDLAH